MPCTGNLHVLNTIMDESTKDENKPLHHVTSGPSWNVLPNVLDTVNPTYVSDTKAGDVSSDDQDFIPATPGQLKKWPWQPTQEVILDPRRLLGTRSRVCRPAHYLREKKSHSEVERLVGSRNFRGLLLSDGFILHSPPSTSTFPSFFLF